MAPVIDSRAKMPRQVDHAARRQQIIAATIKLLARTGPRGLTLRAVGAQMGGSLTLVTHYYPTRQALLLATAEFLVSTKDEFSSPPLRGNTPRQQLRQFLCSTLPTDERRLAQEAARSALYADEHGRAAASELFHEWERHLRHRLRYHVTAAMTRREVEPIADLLRTLTIGITTCTVQHPDRWPAERQLSVLDQGLAHLGLAPGSGSPRRQHGTRQSESPRPAPGKFAERPQLSPQPISGSHFR
jgi:AcrR family transcriptional regulator